MPTLADVARAAGVSKAAASYVLGARPSSARLSADTRRRILASAHKLGYRPNPIATALSTGRTHIIGLLMRSPVEMLMHPNGAQSFGATMTAAARRGYRVLLIDPDPRMPFDARRMDGLIVFGWVGAEWAGKLATMAKALPILSNRESIPGGTRLVDDTEHQKTQAAFESSANYLYDLGHRHIAVVDVYGGAEAFRAVQAFRRVAGRRGLDVELSSYVDRWQARAYPTTEEICRLDPLPTAVFAFDDEYARVLISRLGRRRALVPEDVSVFSRETHRDGFQMVPPLTGMDMHRERMFQKMVQGFIGEIESGDRSSEMSFDPFPAELVVRESCAPPRQ